MNIIFIKSGDSQLATKADLEEYTLTNRAAVQQYLK